MAFRASPQWPFEIVPSEDLVGRERVIEQMLQRLEAGRSILLVAPRRWGKTSTALEVLRRLAANDVITCRLDFLGLTSKSRVAESLTNQVLQSSRDLRSKLDRMKRTIASAAHFIEPSWTVAEQEFGLHFGRGGDDEDTLFDRALDLVEGVAAREHRRAVVFMDEFQEAERNLGQDVYGIMRTKFQAQPNTKQIFAGSQQGLIRTVLNSGSQPFMRYAEEIAIPPPRAEDWVRYILAKFLKVGIRCSEALATVLVERTGCHPGDTMEACAQLYYVAQAEHLKELAAVDVLEIALANTEQMLQRVFELVWTELGEVAHSRIVAQRIAGGQPLSTGLDSVQVTRALKHLSDNGVVTSDDGKLWHARFVQPLFQRYVARTMRAV